jgi:thiamine pyrophosphokinase
VTVPHVLIVGSAPVCVEDLERAAQAADLIVCADGGADAVLDAHILPATVLGDMDSISAHGRARLLEGGVQLVEYPVEKDQTDLELALDFALTHHPARVTVLGALGGARFDHALGNVMLLALPTLRRIDVRMLDQSGEVLAVWDRRTIAGTVGDYVSLMPLSLEATGVCTTGLKYALLGDTLLQGSTRGISNELVDTQATISVESGCLLVRHECAR